MVSLPESASADLNSADFPLARHSDEFANGIKYALRDFAEVFSVFLLFAIGAAICWGKLDMLEQLRPGWRKGLFWGALGALIWTGMYVRNHPIPDKNPETGTTQSATVRP